MPYTQWLSRENITQKLYQYPFVPYYVLIGPNGMIKKGNKGLRVEELIKTLKTLYTD